ncbi:TonB-dependent receptor [Sphingomonas naphthae]|uniref:TonB-dependent receptor n=1 Tax=Sphingomonas naphthae TaxID=1813468 RepID=A0ABY7TG18_9SPHN|nr:TonB-dependent receptor [Sphingomonas naphthae]WCT72172.1 TonB-dependent receptor [Sphingomonas naphthae]
MDHKSFGRRRALLRGAVLMGCNTIALAAAYAQAPQAAPSSPAQPAAANTPAEGEIVVTARQRGETLMSVPVSVSVVTPAQLKTNLANDLVSIGELTPSVIIGAFSANGGSSIAIRGISSPANTAGFEQAVSVAIDGVQTSNGRIALLGFFDLAQVEVLKGPQALFFGKNSDGGVISIKTAGPTASLQGSASSTYEFVGDETVNDVAISGPLGETLGFRVALRYRDMAGWMRNTAGVTANPFYRAATGLAASAATLPGTTSRRVGNNELLGRVTLEFRPSTSYTASLKVFASHYRDDGAGSASQNIGPCIGTQPRFGGIADPYGECVKDNRTTVGDVPAAVAAAMLNGRKNGKAFSTLNSIISSLTQTLSLDTATITSITGLNRLRTFSQSGLDQTTFSQLANASPDRSTEFSQELRFASDFSGPINFMIGGFYGHTERYINGDVKFGDGNYVASSGRIESYSTEYTQKADAVSVFGQLMWKLTDQFELSGGARYTHEKKTTDNRTIYGLGTFNTLNFTFPGETQPNLLRDRFKGDNVSPEVTLSWRPTSRHTLYVAYKTGYKSGGAVSGPFSTATRLDDVNYGPEKVKGFEGGAKGTFFDNRLRATAAVFAYDFTDLQVNSYDPVRTAYVVGNAGKVKQRGVEFEGNFRVTPELQLRSAVTYVHNRYQDYTGQCYGFAFAAGTSRATAVAPPNCSFVNTTALTLQQVFDGRAPARSPDWSGNAGFTLDLPVGDLSIITTGDAFYSGGYYASETMASSTYQKDFWRFNASVGVGAPDNRWRVALVGRNLTNKYYLTFAADRTGGTGIPNVVGEQRGVVARGRQIAVQGSVRF